MVMTETSPREEGDDGHNNQLGTKAVAMAMITMAARATATGAIRATSNKGGDDDDDDNGNDGNDSKDDANQ
jgi:hypothetical protein